MIVALYDMPGLTNVDIADYLSSTLQDPLSRVPGVGQARVFGSGYGCAYGSIRSS